MTRTYKRVNKKRKTTSFNELTEEEKNYVLEYILKKEVSIKETAFKLNLSVPTIGKIFTERYGKRTTNPKQTN
jgi:DNA invertase Pin-like site-specific DNA recombinase